MSSIGAAGEVRKHDKTKSFSKLTMRTRVLSLSLLLVSAVLAVIATTSIFRHLDLNDVEVIKTLIGKHYILPVGEQPALATVTDSARVQSSFGGKVKNGDKILIYQINKKAVVYRPSLDRIVDVEPVSIDTPVVNKNQGQ